MDGVCAECWAPKEPTARRYRLGRTEPLLDLDWDDPSTWLWALLLAAAVGLGAARLLGWI